MYSTDYFSIIVSVLGGLAFFLYGMHLLGTGLEKASGGRLERTLEKMSSNIFKAVLLVHWSPQRYRALPPPPSSSSVLLMQTSSNSNRQLVSSWVPTSEPPSPPTS